MLHQICSVYQGHLCVFLVSSASVGPAFLNLPGSAYINQGRWPKKMGEWGTVILRWEWKSPFSSCGKTFPAVAAGDLSMGLCIFWTLESYVCVCVCCFRDTQECVCANVSVRALFGRGWTEVCVSVGTCLYMNESYAWFVIQRQSGVFVHCRHSHTHIGRFKKPQVFSLCMLRRQSVGKHTLTAGSTHSAAGWGLWSSPASSLPPHSWWGFSIFQRFETQPSLVCGPLCRNSIQSRSSLHSGHPVIAANWRQQWSFFSSSSYKLPLCIPKGVFIFLEATLLCCFLSAALQDFLSFFFFSFFQNY